MDQYAVEDLGDPFRVTGQRDDPMVTEFEFGHRSGVHEPCGIGGPVQELGSSRIATTRVLPARDVPSIIDRLTHIYDSAYSLGMSSTLTVLDVIAEPTRRRILDAVRDGERSVGELVEVVGMHQPGVSRHLKVLRDAGLVEVRRDAQRRLYRLRPEPLMEIDAWLEPYRREWANRLDALERHLERTTEPFDAETEEPR